MTVILQLSPTMILHAPKVQEMIETLGIPVFIDRSSYESQPLGRTEWIKLYGAMMNKEEEAAAFFDSQAQIIEKLKDFTTQRKPWHFLYQHQRFPGCPKSQRLHFQHDRHCRRAKCICRPSG